MELLQKHPIAVDKTQSPYVAGIAPISEAICSAVSN
jgi:hypothetical protein